MPPPVKDITFTSWLEEILGTPNEINAATIAYLRNKYNEYLLLSVKASPSADVSDADIVSAFVEGPEALTDLKGVNTRVSIRELFEDPHKALIGLYENTKKDLFDLDELAQDRRTELATRLMKGYVTDGDGSVPDSKYKDVGTKIDEANNFFLKSINKAKFIPVSLVFPIDPSTGKSTIQLLVDTTNGNDPNGVGKWEDRRAAEENNGQDAYYKPYMGLAGAIASLTATMESTNPRIQSKNTAYQEYSRAVALELGLNLDKTLNANGDPFLESLITKQIYTQKYNDQTQKWELVKIDEAKTGTSGYLGWTKTGEAATGSMIDPRLKGSNFTKIGSLHTVLVDEAGGDIATLLGDEPKLAKALGIDPTDFAGYTPEIKDFYKELARVEELKIRKSYLGATDTGLTLQDKWASAGLTRTLAGQDYSNEIREIWLPNDLDHYINQSSTRLYLLSQRHQSQLQAMLPAQVAKQMYDEEFKKKKAKITMVEVARAKQGGPSLSTAQIEANARAFATATMATKTTEVTDKTNRAMQRLKAAGQATEIASDLFATSTFKEFFENVQSGSVIKSAIVLSRAYGALPDAPIWLRNTAELTRAFDPNVVSAKFDRAIYQSNVFRYQRYTPRPGDETEVFGLLKKIEALGLDKKSTNPGLLADLDINQLLNNPEKLKEFYQKLEDAKRLAVTNMGSMTPKVGTPLDGYIKILEDTGLLQKDLTGNYYFDTAKNTYTAFAKAQTTLTNWANPVKVLKEISGNAAHYTGFAVNNSKGLNPVLKTINTVTGGQLEASAWFDWEITDSAGKALGKYAFKRVKAKEMAGLFETNGVYEVLNAIDKGGLLPRRLGSSATTVEALFGDFGKLDDFYDHLLQARKAYEKYLASRSAGNSAAAAKAIPANLKPYIGILHDLGLLKQDATGKFLFESAFANYKNFVGPGGARNTLTAMSAGANGLLASKRWRLVTRMKEAKRDFDLVFKGNLQIFTGLLKNYNNFVNMLRNYLVKNIIFGTKITSMPVIGKFYAPIQGYLYHLGFSDMQTVTATIKNWRFVKYLSGLGQKLSSNPAILANLTSQALLKKILQSAIAKFGVKALGLLLKSAGFFLSGGISWAITLFGGTIFKASLKLLNFDPGGAGKEVAKGVKSLVNTIKKIIIYPIRLVISLVLGCIAIPIGCLIIIAAIVIPTSIAPLQKMAGPTEPPSQTSTSTKIAVTKTATKTDIWGIPLRHTAIEYTITVNNLTTEELLIDDFRDSLFISWGCGLSPAISYFGDGTFVGTLDAQYDPNKIKYQPLPANGSISMTYKLKDITGDHSTYTNEVQVSVAQEPGKFGSAFASVQLGDGGCSQCPRMAPVQIPPAYISACPGEIPTHQGASYESVDYAGPVGTPIYATFSGSAQSFSSACSTCGYGNYVVITSPLGFYAIFAHMSVVNVPTTPTAVTISQKIGEIGNTGNSTGPHLHYEFRPQGVRCDGQLIEMAPPFVPNLPIGSCGW